MGERAEDGPMAFGDDWPGVFLRGDSAHFYARCIEALVAACAGREDLVIETLNADGLRRLLDGSRVTAAGDPPGTQKLRPWAECAAKVTP